MEQTIGQPVGQTGILRTLNIKKMIKRLLLTSTLLASSALAIQAQDLFLSEGQYYTDESQTTPYTGRYTEFYDDGMLKMELFLKDGRPEGTYVIYYPDGKIAEVRSYYHGIFHGEWRTYNEAGQLTGIASYKGILRFEMFYAKGRKSGIWRTWDDDGKLLTEEKQEE